MVSDFANNPRNRCLNPGWTSQRPPKWNLMPLCYTLTITGYGSRIRGAIHREKQLLSLHLGVVDIKKEAFMSSSTTYSQYIYIYIYIYIYCHPQTDCFILSELFSVARHVWRSKPGSKPVQLYVRLVYTEQLKKAYLAEDSSIKTDIIISVFYNYTQKIFSKFSSKSKMLWFYYFL